MSDFGLVQVSQKRTIRAVQPEDRNVVTTSDELSLVRELEAVLVLYPVVPEAQRVVIAFVLKNLKKSESSENLTRKQLKTYLNLPAEVLRTGKLSLVVWKRALDDATIVPTVAEDRLAMLVPERDVHVLLTETLHRIVGKRTANWLKSPSIFFRRWIRHCLLALIVDEVARRKALLKSSIDCSCKLIGFDLFDPGRSRPFILGYLELKFA